MKEFKKLKFYLPMLTLAGSLALLQPITVYAEEEEEILYEEEGEEYSQEAIDNSTAENVQTTAGQDTQGKTIEEATAENNENAAINADANLYLDNTNYFPATDTSENPGAYIPESARDEVDAKLGNPGDKPGDKPGDNPGGTPETGTPETETPNIPIPKMGITLNDYNKKTLTTTGALLVLAALYKLIKTAAYKFSSSRALKVVAKKESKLSKEMKKKAKQEKKKLKKQEKEKTKELTK